MINYVIIDEEQWCKFVCVDLYDILQVVFIDVDMMDVMLLVLKVVIGVDVLMYVIEGYFICGVWVLIDVLYFKVIEIIVGVLCGLVVGDVGVGEVMVFGQYVVGMGFFNVGFGLVYGMVYLFGVFYNMLYGVVNVILLLYVMCFNVEVIGEKYCDIVWVMGVRVEVLSLIVVCEVVVEVVCQFNCDVGIFGYLCEVGVRKEDILVLVQVVLVDVCIGGNLCEVSLVDIVGLYQVVW